jgi:hypothetical protein
MSTESATTASGQAGGRLTEVKGIKTLKCPEENGTKKEYQYFLDKIENHVMMAWKEGADIGHVVKYGEKPDIDTDKPVNLTEEESKDEVEKTLWLEDVKDFAKRRKTLKVNLTSLYALVKENLSKMTKSKIQSKAGYTKAEKEKDTVWLFAVLEDIMINFEDTKPKIYSLDDQLEKILTLRQKQEDNSDFIKLLNKELKVYEKHGGDFLWGKPLNNDLQEKLEGAKTLYKRMNGGTDMPEDEVTERKLLLKKEIKEYIVAMAIMKRADPARYGPLQKELKNDFLKGNDLYPETVPKALELLNNYDNPNPTTTGQDTNGSAVSLLQTAH